MIQRGNNYAFIDSQNLNLAIRSQGWKLDFAKFRRYLRDKYKIEKAFIFIGFIEKNVSLYEYLRKAGYEVILKPTLSLPGGIVKGNVDAELVLHTMIEFDHFDQAIVVSNDGDFHCLVEYLDKKDKLLRLMIPNRHAYSSLLRSFARKMHFMNDLRWKLQK